MKLLPRNLTHQGLSIIGFPTTPRVLPNFFQKYLVLILFFKIILKKIVQCSITIGQNNTKPSIFCHLIELSITKLLKIHDLSRSLSRI